MGFGGMGMTMPWLVGVLTLAVIWAGVWWMLTAMGITQRQPHRHVPPMPPQDEVPAATTWAQPRFGTTGTVTSEEPDLLHSESDPR